MLPPSPHDTTPVASSTPSSTSSVTASTATVAAPVSASVSATDAASAAADSAPAGGDRGRARAPIVVLRKGEARARGRPPRDLPLAEGGAEGLHPVDPQPSSAPAAAADSLHRPPPRPWLPPRRLRRLRRLRCPLPQPAVSTSPPLRPPPRQRTCRPTRRRRRRRRRGRVGQRPTPSHPRRRRRRRRVRLLGDRSRPYGSMVSVAAFCGARAPGWRRGLCGRREFRRLLSKDAA